MKNNVDKTFCNNSPYKLYIYIYIYIINRHSSKFFLTLFLCFFLQFSGCSRAMEYGAPTIISANNYSGFSFCKEVSNTLTFSSFEVPNFKKPHISNSEIKTRSTSFKREQISLNSLSLTKNFTPPQNGKYTISTRISNQIHYKTLWL